MLQGRLSNLVADTSQEPLVRDLAVTADKRIGAYAGVPLELSDGRVVGSFCCLNHHPRPFDQRDRQLMQVIARLVADQIEQEEARARARRLELMQAEISALTVALAARDGYTEEHSGAVVSLATAVGRRLGLDRAALDDLAHVAVLHDIGKLGVPDAVLHKPGPLDPQEWELMQRHPVVGAEIVNAIPTLAHLSPAIRAEHERWDGTGYPDGLTGEDIPLASRIVLVCDALHAMTSDRPYRATMDSGRAREELGRHAGRQFCRRTTEAALEVLA